MHSSLFKIMNVCKTKYTKKNTLVKKKGYLVKKRAVLTHGQVCYDCCENEYYIVKVLFLFVQNYLFFCSKVAVCSKVLLNKENFAFEELFVQK